MNKKSILIVLISLAILMLSASFAEAGVTDTLKKFGEFLFKDLPTLGDFGFKFLMWIILFSLFDFGLKKAKFDNKTAGILSLVLSLATVLVAPAGIIQHIFNTYWLIVVLTLGIVVPGLLFWFVQTHFPGTTRTDYFMRGVIYIILAAALFYFSSWSGEFIGGVVG